MVENSYLKETRQPLTPLLAIEEASRCLLCYDAPCSKVCPAGTDPAKFIRSIRFKNVKGAVETIRNNNALGAVCARVCPYDKYCEGACSRCGIDKPIKIGELQRFAMDFQKTVGMKIHDKVQATKEKVAIIGSGPSGLSAASELALKGYKVTVFEEKSKIGGWLTYGIPENRLPQEVIEGEIRYIKELGVEFENNCKVGRDISIDKLRKEGFKAFLIACGMQMGKSVQIPGANFHGVIDGVHFLATAKVNKGNINVGKKVVVIGGGDVAMDCAATAKLIGCEDVKIVYRRVIEKMPASIEEKKQINQLNIPIFTGFKPIEILGEKGKVIGFKAEGMFDGSKLQLEADMIIFAIGQESKDVKAIDDAELVGIKTDKDDIFASGDIIEKDKTVVQAVKSGKLAAGEIEKYLIGISPLTKEV